MCDQCDILRRELREAREEIAAWREHDATPTVGDTERVGRWTRRLKLTVGQARARKLWDRLCAGAIYQIHSERTPKAMAELEAAGLLTVIVRPIELWACHAPVGSKSYQAEVIAK